MNQPPHTTTELEDTLWQAFVSSVPGYVIWLDHQLVYLGMNHTFAQDAGVNMQEALGKLLPVGLLHTKPDLKTEMELFFQEETRAKCLHITAQIHNETRHFSLCFEKYHQGQRMLMIGTDITIRWQLEERARMDRELALASARLSSLGEMASGIAHEINNPLALIQGQARKISRKLKTLHLEDDFKELIAPIQDTVMRISRIIHGLRAFSRDGKKDPFVCTSIKTLIEDTLPLCMERFKSKEVTLDVLAEYPPLLVQCRPVQIGQVLINVLNNAFDAMAGMPHPWIKIRYAESLIYVDLIIIDAGLGIPDGIAQHMMEAFFTTKPLGEGTGIGLSISASIMKEHGGELIYEALEGHTAFKLRFPKNRVVPDTLPSEDTHS